MAHIHDIIEDDLYFEIDPQSRSLTYKGSKTELLVQYDKKSERFSFLMPRYIEGHDMYEADSIEIYFENKSANKTNSNDGVYYVKDEDKQIYDDDANKLRFSWLVDDDATLYAGELKFSIVFVCRDENGEVIYSWGTTTISGKWVAESAKKRSWAEDAALATMEIIKNGVYIVGSVDQVKVDVPTADSPLPIEVATTEEMNAILSGEPDAGAVYKYVGETTDTYENGMLYIVEEVSE